MALRLEELAKTIDHLLCQSDPTPGDVIRLCDESCEHHFAAVRVGPQYVRVAAERLRGCDVKVAALVAGRDRKAKAELAEHCVAAGAAEIEIGLDTEAMLAGAFRDRFYVELQRPYERGDVRRNAALRELAE